MKLNKLTAISPIDGRYGSKTSELGEILSGGARVLMISNEHPENVERWPHDPGLANRVQRGVELMEAAQVMTVSSAAGTNLEVKLDSAAVAGSHGWCTEPGSIAHWPGGLVLSFPAAGAVNGTLVLAPGDVNLTFKHYIREPIVVTVDDDAILEATALLVSRQKLIVEYSGAAATAALLSNAVDVEGRAVAAVVSGGNLDPSLLAGLA